MSVEIARNIQRLGHICLGKQTYWELARILRREGISFPPGGIKEAWDEKWSVFGSIFLQLPFIYLEKTILLCHSQLHSGFADIKYLLNIITHNQSDQISILKLQVDG